MAPLQKIAMGLVIVLLDVFPVGFDAVPDVLGWALVTYGVLDLRTRLVGFGALFGAATLSGLVSVALLRPVWTASLPESTGWLLSLPQLVFSILLCAALAGLATGSGPDEAQRFRVLRWVFLMLVAGPVLVYGGGLDVLLVPLAMVTVAANVYLVYLLFRIADQPYVSRSRVDDPA